MIAPMIFITFVENAFKHGISYLGNSFIQMLLKIDVQQIDFSVENSFIESLQEKGKESGHGLEITRKRLELLYPGKHQLHWRHDANKYFVRLIIRF
jgi:LytS/YehU family sensor histidine kinase